MGIAGSAGITSRSNWIAGDNIASGIDLPTVGTAVYNGHIIGTVLNAGAVYQAMGGFGMNFNFADPEVSTIDVTNFDGVGYEVNNVDNPLTNSISLVPGTGVFSAVGTDTSAGPTGETDMDSIQGDATDAQHAVSQAITQTAVVHTFCAFLKKGAENWGYLQDSTLTNVHAWFDLDSGAKGTVGAAGAD